MGDRYRAYASHSSYDRDPCGGYPGYLAPEGSLASYYASRPSVPPDRPDVLRNDVALQPRAYGYGHPAGVINPALPGLSDLPAVARARGPSHLEDPSLAPLSGLAPDRAPGSSLLEELAVMGRSSSLGKGAGIPDVERHSPLPNLDGPSEDESNILFVDCLPTNCTRREVAPSKPSAGNNLPWIASQAKSMYLDGAQVLHIMFKESMSGDKAYVLCFVEFENAKCARSAMDNLQAYRFDDRKPDSPFLKIQFARFPFRLPAAQDERRISR
ncbi:RNA-binding protein 1-like isoform X4 [Panicum miliaceum]|uniref:RNA-binding protein 1-like isoform X4 n=1 Tax=Panicum miliaceum TaxID=4540 RepID=A0A3L6PE11_PANMI|nr:RNA-binding protein 1-like isoform X4 [Panicum miliaceum]